MKTTDNDAYVVSVINAAEFQKTVPMHPQSLNVDKATDVFQKQGALVAKTLSMEKLDQFTSSLKKLPEDYLFQLRYFDNTMIGDGKTSSTRNNYLNYTARFMTWYNWEAQGESLLNVTTDHLRLYRSTALAGLKKSSINQQMCALNHFFENVCSKHVKLDSMRTEMFMPLVPNRQQVRQMFRGCATAVGRLILILLSQCGLRISELLALRPSDFHFDGGSNGNIPYVYIRPMKTHRDRWVWLPDIGVRAYNEYIHSFVRGHAPKAEEFLFPGKKAGTAMTSATVENRLRLLQEQLGWEGPFFSPHGLRHYFGRSLFLNGLTAEEIAQMMGHSKLSSTYVYMRSAILDVTLQKVAAMKGKPPVSEFGLQVRSAYRFSSQNQ